MKQLVKANVKLAFKIAKAFLKTAVFSNATASFDFAVGQATVSATPEVALKGFLSNVIKRRPQGSSREPNNLQNAEFVVLTEDITTEISVFSKVTIDSIEWKVVPPIKSSDFITTVDLVREK